MTNHKAAYDAVYAYIDQLGNQLPPDPAHRNAMIWTAVSAALEADTSAPSAVLVCSDERHKARVQELEAGVSARNEHVRDLETDLQHAECENRRLREELKRL